MYCKIIQEIYLKNKEESCNSSRNDEISKGFINVRDVNRTIVISFLYVFPLYVFSMYFNLTFYTSFNYFYWNFSSNFLIDFPQYEWLFFFSCEVGKSENTFSTTVSRPQAPPHEWLFFPYIRGEIQKHVFDKFRHFEKFRHYSTNFDIIRQISTNFAISIDFDIIFRDFDNIFRQISQFRPIST